MFDNLHGLSTSLGGLRKTDGASPHLRNVRRRGVRLTEHEIWRRLSNKEPLPKSKRTTIIANKYRQRFAQLSVQLAGMSNGELSDKDIEMIWRLIEPSD